MEVNVNLKNLESKIRQLNSLQKEIFNLNKISNSDSGSGKTFDVIKNIEKQCEILNKAMLHIVSNSIMFFENIKKSTEEADEKASNKIK